MGTGTEWAVLECVHSITFFAWLVLILCIIITDFGSTIIIGWTQNR